MDKVYLCIDFKTFFASVECVERGIDPFQQHLVVADPSRGQGAICLAVTPSLKKLGVKNRCRIFEIPTDISYITALPRMRLYMEYAARIYAIYLKYIAKEDIHVYSIDEAFIDITAYLELYHQTPKALAQMILKDIYHSTGITATVGIGSNLYLAKIALDITAKHAPDFTGILDEKMYRETLWHHRPLTDFWQIGKGISRRLANYQLYDMYDIAHCQPELLFKEFGINAQYLIDHAWGIEPLTIADIKNYRPKQKSISSGQILFEDYQTHEALLIVKEMVEVNVLRLVDQHLVSDHIGLYIGYSKNCTAPTSVSTKIPLATNSCQILTREFVSLFEKHVKKNIPIRKLTIHFDHLQQEIYETYDLFTDVEALEKERRLQKALLSIKNKYGKNAVFKAMDLTPKATTLKRNLLIGGHNAQ